MMTMKKSAKYFLLAVLILPLPGYLNAGNIEQVNVQAEGLGKTREAAISAALSEAVSKINGVSVSASNRSVSGKSSIKTDSNTQSVAVMAADVNVEQHVQGESKVSGKDNQSIDANVNSNVKVTGAAVMATASRSENNVVYDASQLDVTTKSSGEIKNYTVLKSEQRSDGFYVLLDVSVAKYKVSKEAHRKRVAVVPFRVKRSGSNSNDFERQFSQVLVNQLTQSRKFSVLDRDYLSEQGAELGRLQSDEVSVDEMAKLGNKLNTDYLLVGSINAVVSRKHSVVMKSTGKEIPMIDQGARLSYRLVDAATGQVMFSDDYDNVTTNQGQASSISSMAKNAGRNVAQNILINFFPVLVEGVEDNLLILGRGGDTIKIGDKFLLIRYGKEITDSYTQESLGRLEKKVGTVEVVNVTGKLSKAKVITASVDINKNFELKEYILRPLSETKKSINKKTIKSVKVESEKRQKILEESSSDDW